MTSIDEISSSYTESSHPGLQGTALQSEQASGPFWTTDYPVRCIQGLEDVATFGIGHAEDAGGFVQRLAKGVFGDLQRIG